MSTNPESRPPCEGTKIEEEPVEGVVAIGEIAQIAHEATRVYCDLCRERYDNLAEEDEGEEPGVKQPFWNQLSGRQIAIVLDIMKFHLDNPDAGDGDYHNQWMEEQIKDGWVYGEVKDREKKIDPNLVPFDELLLWERKVHALYRAVVNVFRDVVER